MNASIRTQPEQSIQNRLCTIQRRMQRQNLFQNLARCNLGGFTLIGMLLIVNRLIRIPIPIGTAVLMILTLSICLTSYLSLRQRISLLSTAHAVDEQCELKERLSTALQSIQRGEADEFALAQIRDAAKFAEAMNPAEVVPYTLPSTLKWFPIPVLLIGLAFVMPHLYELPAPPTAAERAAIENAADELQRTIKGVDDKRLAAQMRDTAKALRDKRIDTQNAQAQLSKLRDEIRNRKDQTSEESIKQATEAIAQLNNDFQRFKGMDAGEMAAELEKLADQPELPPELQRELQELLKKLTEQLAGNPAAGNLMAELSDVQTQTVSPEKLKQIARELSKLNQLAKRQEQLNQLLDEIKASRKNIALAGIEMNRESSGGVPNPGGGAGEESGTGLAKQPSEQLPTDVSPTENTDLTLQSLASDSENFSKVFVGEDSPNGGDEPAYLPYREVYLKAQKNYATAIENNRIPVRYRAQIEDYLRAIAEPESVMRNP